MAGMARMVFAESAKLVRTPTAWALIALASAVQLWFSLVVGVPGVQTAMILTGIVGVVLAGADVASGPALILHAVGPRRIVVVAAKALVAAVVAAVPTGLLIVACHLLAQSYVSFDGGVLTTDAFVQLLLGSMLAVACAAVLGVSLAVLLRSSIRAIIAWVLLIGLVQGAVPAIGGLLSGGRALVQLPAWLQSALPSQVFTRLLGSEYLTQSPSGGDAALALAYVWAVCWVGALLVPALIVHERVDIRGEE